ncbi:MAG: MmgE/PrpD family protein [Oscillospiraceae bacterium]|nr:MmgE/PrpD family protein [Oscillospiraceae bacterium]
MENTELKSRVFARFIAGLRYEDLPEAVVTETKRRILDFVAAAYAGRKINGALNDAIGEVLEEMGGAPQSTVLFTQKKYPAANAAFANAAYGHGADMDDGHKTAMGHPDVTIVPPVFALAEARGLPMTDVITAIVAGYEMYVRLGNAVMPSLFNRGFHGTGVIGAVAASTACGKLLGYDEDTLHKAISLGALHAAGLFNVSDSGQMTKPVNPAHASHSGVISALLAGKPGVVPPQDPFEGPKSFFHAFADEVNPDALTDGLGKKYMITTAYIKLYPACRHLHPAVDAGIDIYRSGQLDLDKLEKIIIYTYAASIKSVGNIRYPASEDDAKFSIFYALACAMTTGNYSFRDLAGTAELSDDARRIIGLTEVELDPACEDRAKGIRGSRLELCYSDRDNVVVDIQLPKGEPESPLSEADMRGKLAMCTEEYLSQADQDRLYDAIMGITPETRVADILTLCR